MHIRVILLCSFLLVSWSSFAQSEALEDSAFFYRQQVFTASDDSSRLQANEDLLRLFRTGLSQPATFRYPFSKLKNISVLTSPDNNFRIYTWNVELTDFQNRIFGFVQVRSGKQVKLTELREDRSESRDWESVTCGANDWFGAVYYKIIPTGNGKHKKYTLLGWKGKDRLVSRKVMEVLQVKGDQLVFGSDIIHHGNSVKKRAVFHYPAKIAFSLKYQENDRLVVFDRLAPVNPGYAGNYAFYSPQAVFDAYKSEDGKWFFVQDVDVKMPERKRKPMVPAPGASVVRQ